MMNMATSAGHLIIQVDENAARLTAAWVLLVLVIALATSQQWLLWLLALDFLVRSFAGTQYNPLAYLSRATLKLFRIRPKLIFGPPKIFAARVGLGLVLAIVAAWTAGGPNWLVWILAGCLFTAASLEAFFAFCLGCRLYGVLHSLRS